MKIFISWSGSRSKAVAEILVEWIKCVLQASHPWVSTRDIDKGALWFQEIFEQLKDTSMRLVCLTQENKNRPWILFECGALAKGLSSNRVCTILVDLKPTDVENPLAQFNHTEPTRDGMKSLIRMLNSQLESPLEEKVLDRIFDTYWPQFEKSFSAAIEHHPLTTKPEIRSDNSKLDEILENTRSLQHRVNDLEAHATQEAIPGWDGFFKKREPRSDAPRTTDVNDPLYKGLRRIQLEERGQGRSLRPKRPQAKPASPLPPAPIE